MKNIFDNIFDNIFRNEKNLKSSVNKEHEALLKERNEFYIKLFLDENYVIGQNYILLNIEDVKLLDKKMFNEVCIALFKFNNNDLHSTFGLQTVPINYLKHPTLGYIKPVGFKSIDEIASNYMLREDPSVLEIFGRDMWSISLEEYYHKKVKGSDIYMKSNRKSLI